MTGWIALSSVVALFITAAIVGSYFINKSEAKKATKS